MRRGLAALLLIGCGGGDEAVCGNGKIEKGEQCDDGNLADDDACSSVCRAQSTVDTFIKFVPLIAEQFPGFFESCTGLGIENVDVALTGPTTKNERVPCSFGQLKLASLPAGNYTVTLRALDRSGNSLSRGMAKKDFTVSGATQTVQVDWPYEDFTGSYKGTFFFRIFWGDVDTCLGASPPVMKQRLRLERDGVAVAGMTQNGTPLDGTAAGACRDAREALDQAAIGLAWGPARLTVTGEDDSGKALYRGSFDTFVGADISNPTMDFRVPSLAPDAGVPDAGVPDAL